MRCKLQSKSALSWRRYGPSVEGISSVRLLGAKADRGAKVYDPRTPCRAQKAVDREPEKARAEAEGYAALGIGPRRGIRQSVSAGNPPGTQQVFVGQAASDDAANDNVESFGVVNVLAGIEAKRLFVQ